MQVDTEDEEEGEENEDEYMSSSSEESFYENIYSNPYQLTNEDIDEFIMDEIDCIEEHLSENTQPTKYKIGIYNVFMESAIKYHTFGFSISAFTFFRYDYITLLNYLLLSTLFTIDPPFRKIEIIYIVTERDEDGNELELAIIKTFWIRLIQRRWKKRMQERKQVLEMRKQLSTFFFFELRGKYPYGAVNYPSLRGMLSDISSVKGK
jgi:hypothetical protein